MNKKWLELAHDKNCYLYPTSLYWLAAQYACKKVGIKNNVICCLYRNHEFSYLSTEGGLLEAGKIILEKLKQSDELLNKIEYVNNTEIDAMLKAAEKFSGDLSLLSGKELYNLWSDWLNKFISMMTYSVMATVMEMEEPLLSNEVETILKNKLNNSDILGEYFQILTSSPRETVINREELALMQLRLLEIDNKLEDAEIISHLAQYSWIGFGYNGPAWIKKDIKQRLSLLPKNKQDLLNLLKSKQNSSKHLSERQLKIEKELDLNSEEKRLIFSLRTLGFWKFERKAFNQKAHLVMENFIKELARRNSLSKVQAYMIAPSEMKQALLDVNIDANLMNQRIKESVVIFKGINYEVLSGASAKEIIQDIDNSLQVDMNIKELRGNIAYSGSTIVGFVRRVDEAEDMKKMKSGDILVSTSTNPQIVAAMQKAAAIITDSGGITCHAAIVSRELKVPCIIGTKIATKILKDGDRVEVDANNGIIKKI